MVKFSFFPMCLACFLFLMNSSTRAKQHRYSEDFLKSLSKVSGKKLIVNNMNGGASIVAWGKDKIEIKAKKEVSSNRSDIPQKIKEKLKEIRIDIEETENSIKINTVYPKDLWSENKYQFRVSFEIYVPQKIDIEIETLNGGLAIEGVKGAIHGRTMNGSIILEQLGGEVDMLASNGNISFKEIFGECDISSLNGGISGEFESLNEPIDLKIKSMNGGVSIELAQAEGIEIFARCMNGSLFSNIPLVKSRSKLKGEKKMAIEVSNGSIEINKK